MNIIRKMNGKAENLGAGFAADNMCSEEELGMVIGGAKDMQMVMGSLIDRYNSEGDKGKNIDGSRSSSQKGILGKGSLGNRDGKR